MRSPTVEFVPAYRDVQITMSEREAKILTSLVGNTCGRELNELYSVLAKTVGDGHDVGHWDGHYFNPAR